MLDAELLADVYINLTRGQDALLISDESQEDAGGVKMAPIDLSSITLQVLRASDAELAEHDATLAQIDKASGGKTIWKTLAQA